MRSSAAILCLTKVFHTLAYNNFKFLDMYLLFDLDETTWPETAKFLGSKPASARFFQNGKITFKNFVGLSFV